METINDSLCAERDGVVRTLRFSATGIVVVLLLLYIPLLFRVISNTPQNSARVLIYAIPQALTLALIIGFPLGAFVSLGGRIVSRRSAGAVIALALGCSAVSAGMLTSLVPAANRAVRHIAAVGARKPAQNELTFAELRRQRDVATRAGDLEYGRSLDVYYHTRWAFSFVPVVFVLLALSVTRSRRVSQMIRGIAFCGVLAGYYVLFHVGMKAALSGTLPVLAAAWLPNLMFGAVSAGVAALHQRPS